MFQNINAFNLPQPFCLPSLWMNPVFKNMTIQLPKITMAMFLTKNLVVADIHCELGSGHRHLIVGHVHVHLVLSNVQLNRITTSPIILQTYLSYIYCSFIAVRGVETSQPVPNLILVLDCAYFSKNLDFHVFPPPGDLPLPQELVS